MTVPAILFLVFNRPDTTAVVFEKIKEARPAKLYVAADGPRMSRPGEAGRCAEVRRIATNVDWPCELKTLFRDENLGCGRACSSAIDWLFESESEGIILEDDTLPSASFFKYCAEALDKYRDDRSVYEVCGYNHFPSGELNGVFKSRYTGVWGWATWADRWHMYDYESLEKFSFADPVLNSDRVRLYEKYYLKRLFPRVRRVDSWDYQLLHAMLTQGAFCLRPTQNLVENIGFGEGATHTVEENFEIQKNKAQIASIDVSRIFTLFGEIADARFFFYRYNNGFFRFSRAVSSSIFHKVKSL